VLFLTGSLAFALGCGRPHAATPAAGTGTAAALAQDASVTTVLPERKSLPRVIEQPGHIEAFEETPLFARIAGYVQKVHVDIGDRVRVGDVLAEVSVPEMEEELKQKEALVAQAQAEVAQAQGALRAAGANVETANALVRQAEANRARAGAEFQRWESEYKRVQALVVRRVLDEQTRDETHNQFQAAAAAREEVEAKVKSAEAARDESAAHRDKAKADVSAAAAKLQVRKADQRRLEALLGYARVKAPFEGIVNERNIHTGHLLHPGSASGEPLFVVVRIDPVRVFVDVPEADAVLIQPGAAARVRVQVLRGREFAGKVTRSAWALNAKTRTLRTEIDLPNPDGLLRPGMYAYASITSERPAVWTLPAAAVVLQGDQAFCFRVENGKAVRTPVRVGARDGAAIEVLGKQTGSAKAGAVRTWEDFNGDEVVISLNPAGLTDGQAVTVRTNP
jgi:RND family efflux transporter MFP subunit